MGQYSLVPRHVARTVEGATEFEYGVAACLALTDREGPRDFFDLAPPEQAEYLHLAQTLFCIEDAELENFHPYAEPTSPSQCAKMYEAAQLHAKHHLREAWMIMARYGGDDYRRALRELVREWQDADAPPMAVPLRRGYQKKPIPHELRRAVLERDAYRCQECDDWHNLAVDHIHPESKGGEATMENLRVLCRSCNSRKGARV